MTLTKIENLVNPQVMGDMIAAKLPAAIKVSPFAKIDTTLVGQPGNTITVPSYQFIGEGVDVAEGVALDPELLTASTTSVTVKKIGKALELSDEAVLSAYGDPVGTAENQLLHALASKIDTDCMVAYGTAPQSYDGSAGVISYDGIVSAIDLFSEEDVEAKVIFVHPNQVTQLRKDPNFLSQDKYPANVVMNGQIGMICGCAVVPSKRVVADATNYTNIIAKAEAITIYLKAEAQVESGRDILKKTTVLSADQHYAVALSDESKVVKATFKK